MVRLIVGIVLFAAMILPAFAEKRVALVIGNGAYSDATPLNNPVNDASDMTQVLGRLGFEVISGTDLDYDSMRRTLRDFTVALDSADVALFFYAGHAVQVNGLNYLAPIDTVLEREADLEFSMIDLSLVQRLMEREAETQLIFLDACRDNPLTRRLTLKSRSLGTGNGLARPELSPEGTYLVFATQPGNIALDGTGRNSPFTGALLRNIERPGIEISSLMTDVRKEVYFSTDKQQLPWSNSGLLGHFYFLLEEEETQSAAIEDLDPIAAKPKTEQAEAEEKDNVEADAAESQQVAKLDQSSGENPASRETIRSIQKALSRAGCDPGSADGLWGRKSRTALAAFAQHAGRSLVSTEPSIELLRSLEGLESRVCPLVCGPRFEIAGDECVRKTCPAGQKLSTKGACYTPRKTASSSRRSSSGNCFMFNGKRVCD